MICQSGGCQELCGDECSSSRARQCTDEQHFQPCGDFDGDGCLEWGETTACDRDKSCVDGDCLAPCDECPAEGDLRCRTSTSDLPDGIEVCSDPDSDDCLEWTLQVECSTNEVCTSNECISGCAGPCRLDQRSCTATLDGSRLCIEDDSGCPSWGSPIDCPPGYECDPATGICDVLTCDNECDVAGTSCSLDGLTELDCANTDTDPCLELTRDPCGTGFTCVVDHCEETCDECTPEGPGTCSGNTLEPCILDPLSSCWVLGPPQICGTGFHCNAETNTCEPTCMNTCTSNRCEGVHFYLVCEDHNGDGCTELGVPTECEDETFCSSGSCSVSVSVNEIGLTIAGTDGTSCTADGLEFDLEHMVDWAVTELDGDRRAEIVIVTSFEGTGTVRVLNLRCETVAEFDNDGPLNVMLLPNLDADPQQEILVGGGRNGGDGLREPIVFALEGSSFSATSADLPAPGVLWYTHLAEDGFDDATIELAMDDSNSLIHAWTRLGEESCLTYDGTIVDCS